MSSLKRPLRRKTDCLVRERGRMRALIVELHPRHLLIWPSRLRRGYPVSYEAIYWLGAKIVAEARRREKAGKKTKR